MNPAQEHKTHSLLDYAPAPRLGYFRRFWRQGVCVACLLALMVGWFWRKDVLRWTQYEYDWRRLQHLDLESSRAVYEGDPAKAAKLMSQDPAYRPPVSPQFDRPWYPNPPAEWGPPALYRPSFTKRVWPKGPGLAYTGMRRTPAGQEVLATVWVGHSAFSSDGYRVAVVGGAYRKGNSVSGPDYVGARNPRTTELEGFNLLGFERLTVYAAQDDPNDASHATIAYVLDGGRGMVDVWVRDVPAGTKTYDGAEAVAYIDVTIRDGPAAGRPHSSYLSRHPWILTGQYPTTQATQSVPATSADVPPR